MLKTNIPISRPTAYRADEIYSYCTLNLAYFSDINLTSYNWYVKVSNDIRVQKEGDALPQSLPHLPKNQGRRRPSCSSFRFAQCKGP